jgi:enterochelin esterase family protein
MARSSLAFVVPLVLASLVGPRHGRAAALEAPSPDDRPASPQIAALAESVRKGDATAVERFWRALAGKAPLVEPIEGEPDRRRVTFVWRGDEKTRRVFLIGAVPGGDDTLDRLDGTDVWYLTETIPAAARFGYMFMVNYPKMVSGDYSRNPMPRPDPLNPTRMGLQSIVELPNAPRQPWLEPRDGVAVLPVNEVPVQSTILPAAPRVWVAEPAGRRRDEPAALLVMLDGETTGGNPNDTLIPTPTIVANLAAAGKIPRTLVVMVGSGDFATRSKNLRGSEPFVDYLAKELVPWVRSRYAIGSDRTRTVIAGQSNGGLAAAHAALRHPEVFGGVLSQSGAFWFDPSVGTSHASKYDTPTGWLTREFAALPARPVHFYVEVGLFEQGTLSHMLLENRRFRDVLIARGYRVTYSEYLGGHDYVCWRGSLADGLIALLGRGD